VVASLLVQAAPFFSTRHALMIGITNGTYSSVFIARPDSSAGKLAGRPPPGRGAQTLERGKLDLSGSAKRSGSWPTRPFG
jgi:hypothetical protein